MFHLLLHSFVHFVVSTLCTEKYITVCDHVARDKYRHSKNKFVINFKIFCLSFSNVNHPVIARITAGLFIIMITGNDTKSSTFMTRKLKIFTKYKPCQYSNYRARLFIVSLF
jgi:hypothetical protein